MDGINHSLLSVRHIHHSANQTVNMEKSNHTILSVRHIHHSANQTVNLDISSHTNFSVHQNNSSETEMALNLDQYNHSLNNYTGSRL